MKPLKGIVVSTKMPQTVAVQVSRFQVHQLYRRRIKIKKNYLVHDQMGVGVGDWVEIQECRPISKRKRWQVIKVIKKSK